MAEISASDVKSLREKTGAGILDCKKALTETGGDFEKAVKLLREKGLAAIEKRSGRATNEGKVFIKIKDDGSKAVLVELASETDFVARNPDFIALGGAIASKALEKGYAEPNDELNGMVTELATKIRENMSLKRIKTLEAGPNEFLTSYIHGDGAIGVVVKVTSDKSGIFKQDDAAGFAFTLALHIAAYNPMVLDREKVDAAWLKEQEEIFRKQMEQDEKMKGKPADALDKILKGKVNKFLKDICLLDQGYVKDEKITVTQAIADIGKQLGAKISVTDYVYFNVGA
ncbi:MAG: translation elongation factor Ts [Treponema sp.]|jgi:elongation factor Ts|nr:translation elongation factor Ts [Treponema sp.]